jgi:hypothetical protein
VQSGQHAICIWGCGTLNPALEVEGTTGGTSGEKQTYTNPIATTGGPSPGSSSHQHHHDGQAQAQHREPSGSGAASVMLGSPEADLLIETLLADLDELDEKKAPKTNAADVGKSDLEFLRELQDIMQTPPSVGPAVSPQTSPHQQPPHASSSHPSSSPFLAPSSLGHVPQRGTMCNNSSDSNNNNSYGHRQSPNSYVGQTQNTFGNSDAWTVQSSRAMSDIMSSATWKGFNDVYFLECCSSFYNEVSVSILIQLKK